MAEMTVYIPDDIAHHVPELRFFVDLMVRKLHINRHKGFGENVTIPVALKAIDAEFNELQVAWADGDQFEFSVEAADVANSAFIAALVALRLSKPEYRNTRPLSAGTVRPRDVPVVGIDKAVDPCFSGHLTNNGVCIHCGWKNPEVVA